MLTAIIVIVIIVKVIIVLVIIYHGMIMLDNSIENSRTNYDFQDIQTLLEYTIIDAL